jgi:hypothetical protein
MNVVASDRVPKVNRNPRRSVATRNDAVETRNSPCATTRLLRRPIRSPT